MKLINWSTSKENHELIGKITKRAMEFSKRVGVKLDRMDCLMDLTACHCNGTPLDLQAMLEGSDADFGHDIYGIRRHINRQTGELEGCFLPRFAAKEALA